MSSSVESSWTSSPGRRSTAHTDGTVSRGRDSSAEDSASDSSSRPSTVGEGHDVDGDGDSMASSRSERSQQAFRGGGGGGGGGGSVENGSRDSGSNNRPGTTSSRSSGRSRSSGSDEQSQQDSNVEDEPASPTSNVGKGTVDAPASPTSNASEETSNSSSTAENDDGSETGCSRQHSSESGSPRSDNEDADSIASRRSSGSARSDGNRFNRSGDFTRQSDREDEKRADEDAIQDPGSGGALEGDPAAASVRYYITDSDGSADSQSIEVEETKQDDGSIRQKREAVSAPKIQRSVRKSQAKERTGRHDSTNSTSLEEEIDSANKIQRKVREQQARARADRFKERQNHAATRIQATVRGCGARRRRRPRVPISPNEEGETPPEAVGEIEAGAPHSRPNLAGKSPQKVGSTGCSLVNEVQETSEANERLSVDDDHTFGAWSGFGGTSEHNGRSGNKRKGIGRDERELGEVDAARIIQRRIGQKSPTRQQTQSLRHPSTEHERAGDAASLRNGKTLKEDQAARLIQRKIYLRRDTRGKDNNRPAESGVIGRGSGKGEGLGEDEAARLIQRARKGKGKETLRQAQNYQQETIADEEGIPEDVIARSLKSRDHDRMSSNSKAEASDERNPNSSDGRYANRTRKGGKPEFDARSPRPSQGHLQPTTWMSPGKVAATAAAAAAKEAARAAAASMRAAKAATDAAEAAEVAAEEEDMRSYPPGGDAFRSPRASSKEDLEHPSPYSAFWLTQGNNKEGALELQDCTSSPKASSPKRHSPQLNDGRDRRRPDGEERQEQRGGGGREEKVRHRGHGNETGNRVLHTAQGDEAGGESEDGRRREATVRGSSGEEMLRKARDQVRRHERDRRARALAKEEESKRELLAVQAELVRAEELRERQARAEKSALEAKRARVLEDMKRRQQRLRRLQDEEGRRQSSSSRLSSADASTVEGYRKGAGEDRREDLARAEGNVAASLSLPPLAREGGTGARRRPRHVSAFRERILEERRARKEVDILKRKEVEEKHSRQAEYAAKIRAQAKRALAAEQRRAQEDADKNARRRNQSSSVDRTPIAIKRPKREGEWGVFSYAPDRPPRGAAPRKGHGSTFGGFAAASTFGATERVQRRPESSELVERMKKERAKATEASRARAAAAEAAAATTRSGPGSGERDDESGSLRANTEHRSNEPNGSEYKARRIGGDGGGGTNWTRKELHQYGSSTPARQRGEVGVCGGRPDVDSGHRGGGGGGEGRLKEPPRYQGGRDGHPPSNTYVAASAGAKDSVHGMYEERLATLERRLAGAGKSTQKHAREAPARTSGGRGSFGAGKWRARGAAGEERHCDHDDRKDSSSRRPPPRGGGEEWGEENNPFGYRNLSVGGTDPGFGCVPSSRGMAGSTAAPSRRGSEASGGTDAEGLSTMYMEAIAKKMAELRASDG